MLVTLSIKNFKSIREAHVRFGPFTCFIGHNGVGKRAICSMRSTSWPH